MTTLKLAHFATKYNKETKESSPDKSKIWVILTCENEDAPTLASGYINNIWNYEEFEKYQTVEAEILEHFYMEHYNGGRTNQKRYSSPEEYWADPSVKVNVQKSYGTGWSFSFGYSGDPDRLDVFYKFKIKDFQYTFELSSTDYDQSAPPEWYNEVHQNSIKKLQSLESFSSADDAINFNRNQPTDDLFGTRFFPVLKAPKDTASLMEDICYSFKSCSTQLTDDEYVYIGIRSKERELDTIYEIYEKGGTILKDACWDWD